MKLKEVCTTYDVFSAPPPSYTEQVSIMIVYCYSDAV